MDEECWIRFLKQRRDANETNRTGIIVSAEKLFRYTLEWQHNKDYEFEINRQIIGHHVRDRGRFHHSFGSDG